MTEVAQRPAPVQPLRYSPQPIDAYNAKIAGTIDAGPGHAVFLRDDPEAWNLAFLSHPYEKQPENLDGQFTVNVRRTVNTVIATGEVDVLGKLPARLTVRRFLQGPPQDFIHAVESLQCLQAGKMVALLDRLPMYQAYGDEWLETMRERAGLCLSAPVATDTSCPLPGDDVTNVDDAAAALAKFRA